MQHNVPTRGKFIQCQSIARHAFAMPPQHFEKLMDAYNHQRRIHDLQCETHDYETYIHAKSLLKLISWYEDQAYRDLPRLADLRRFATAVLKPPKRKANKALRIDVAYRQGYACNACGKFPIPPTFQLDHIIRLADGGADDISNLQALCVECHATKTRAEQTGRAPVQCQQIFSKYFLRK